MKTAEQIMKQKAFLKEEIDRHLTGEEADAVWQEATGKLAEYLERYASLPKGLHVHTDSRILPAAAVYLALKEKTGQPEAYRILEDATYRRAEELGKKLASLMRIPGMKSLFVRIWDPLTKMVFGEKSGFKNVFYPKKKGEYRMDVVSCPYFRYFTELGCPEITKLSCGTDDKVYGNLPGLKFERTETLGRGGSRCDFCIRKIQE